MVVVGAGGGGKRIYVATNYTFTVKTTGIVDTRNNNECSLFLFFDFVFVWLGLRKVQSSKQDNRISTHPPTHPLFLSFGAELLGALLVSSIFIS